MNDQIPNSRNSCKPLRFTFEKEPRETGLSGVGNPHPSTKIKLDGCECGRIAAPNWQTHDGKWSVGLMVASTSEENCSFRWAFFKPRFDTEPDAREWLKAMSPVISEKYEIHKMT